MCDQWQNTALLDLNPHILACVKCLYRKLDQFKQSSDENKEKMKQMKKTKDGLKAQIDELIPDRTDEHNIRILESIKVMDVDVAYVEEKMQLVEDQIQDVMTIVKNALRAQKSKRNSIFNRRKATEPLEK